MHSRCLLSWEVRYFSALFVKPWYSIIFSFYSKYAVRSISSLSAGLCHSTSVTLYSGDISGIDGCLSLPRPLLSRWAQLGTRILTRACAGKLTNRLSAHCNWIKDFGRHYTASPLVFSGVSEAALRAFLVFSGVNETTQGFEGTIPFYYYEVYITRAEETLLVFSGVNETTQTVEDRS